MSCHGKRRNRKRKPSHFQQWLRPRHLGMKVTAKAGELLSDITLELYLLKKLRHTLTLSHCLLPSASG